MKKFLLATLSIFVFSLVSQAQFGISSSAVCLNVNGSSALYNTQGSLGRLSFSNNLGAFGSNSGNLKIMGGAMNTTKSSDGNVPRRKTSAPNLITESCTAILDS